MKCFFILDGSIKIHFICGSANNEYKIEESMTIFQNK